MAAISIAGVVPGVSAPDLLDALATPPDASPPAERFATKLAAALPPAAPPPLPTDPSFVSAPDTDMTRERDMDDSHDDEQPLPPDVVPLSDARLVRPPSQQPTVATIPEEPPTAVAPPPVRIVIHPAVQPAIQPAIDIEIEPGISIEPGATTRATAPSTPAAEGSGIVDTEPDPEPDTAVDATVNTTVATTTADPHVPVDVDAVPASAPAFAGNATTLTTRGHEPPAVRAAAPAAGAAGLERSDMVRYLREIGPSREVQRLAIDLDGARVAVRVAPRSEAASVRVEIVHDPAQRLDGVWVAGVERAVTHAVRSEPQQPFGDGHAQRHAPPRRERDDDPPRRPSARWDEAAVELARQEVTPR